MVLVRKYSKRKIHDVSIHLPKKKEFAVRGGGGRGMLDDFPLEAIQWLGKVGLCLELAGNHGFGVFKGPGSK